MIGDGAAAPPNAAILVVEDDAILRLCAAAFLEDVGYGVFEACCADEALEILHAYSGIIAILTDIEMPGSIDGIALAHRVYASWPDVGVIVTSGHVQPSADALPLGALFIGKPYSNAEVIGCIQTLTLAGR